MAGSNEKPLKNLINSVLESQGLKDKMYEAKLIDEWEDIVGPMIAKHTSRFYVQNRIMFIKLDSAPLKQELMYSDKKLLKIINDALGEKFLTGISFR